MGGKQASISLPPSPSSSSSPFNFSSGAEVSETVSQSKRSVRGKTKSRKSNNPSPSGLPDNRVSKDRVLSKSPIQKDGGRMLPDNACIDDSSSSSTTSNGSSCISSATDVITSSSLRQKTKSPSNAASIGYVV